MLHEFVLVLADLPHLVQALQFMCPGGAVYDAPLDVAQKLDAPRIEQRVVLVVGRAVNVLGLVILDGTAKDPVELKGEVEGLLRDDEGKTLEDSVVPRHLKVDDHVGELGKVELDTVENVMGSRVLGHELGHELHHGRIVPELPQEHHHLLHRNSTRLLPQDVVHEAVLEILVLPGRVGRVMIAGHLCRPAFPCRRCVRFASF
mmetsp:Transcript_20823/g.60618  ORF Transcript_20823/g.60618 Transcript_20823/m.60618 type:complete len:203 (+) Transcript_20823:3065-3673(+)